MGKPLDCHFKGLTNLDKQTANSKLHGWLVKLSIELATCFVEYEEL